jgi:hypothetical protein
MGVGHPDIVNKTPFAFEPLFIADEDLRPVVVTLVKATFSFDANGTVAPADEQVTVNFAGEPWTEAPLSSYKYEPETALCKLATDVVLIGQAQPQGGGATQVDVGIKVGPVQKLARVFGDRFWILTKHGVVTSRTGAVEQVPLTWERAFGGLDERRSTPERTLLEPRNPVGTGFGKPLAKDGDSLKLPNIEDPNQLIGNYGDSVVPCGFGFTSPNWQPRATFAGIYNEEWDRSRKPLLPKDFDRRFFNAAAPGLVAPGYLRGDEDVVVLNASSVPRLAFRLPGVPPPQCRVVQRNRPDTTLLTNLDTVIVNTNEQRLLLLWRAYALVGSGPHDVTAIEVATAN